METLSWIREPGGGRKSKKDSGPREEEEFRLSFEQAPVGMALLSGEGVWLHANRALCEMTGYPEQELIALDHNVTHPDDMPETRRLIRRMASGETSMGQIEKRYKTRNGDILHLLVNVSALPKDESGKPRGFVAHMADITKLKMAEQALRESNALFRGLLESAPDAVVIVNAAGQIELINAQTEKLFGYSKGELLGAEMEVLVPHRFRLRHGSHRAGYTAAPQVRVMGEQRELFGLHKDGREIPVEVSLSPLQVGTEIWVTSTIRDVTARKRVEAELDASRMLAVVAGRLSTLGEMAAGIAHEVNTPLTVIGASALNLVHMVEEGERSVPDMLKQLGRITQTADSIARIVKSLRNLGRDDSREGLRAVPVVEIVDECVELCAERFRVHSVRLSVPKIDTGLVIECREAQIGQVLLNLLNNAFDAVGSASEKWVKLKTFVQDSSVIVAVSDSGGGVPADVRSRIMEPFFTTKPVGKGTGLGLSLSRSIAESHSGRLELSDAPGETCFLLTLPLAARAAVAV